MATSGLPPSTPQRPLPGAFLTTPAPAPSIFSQNAQSLRQQPQSAPAPGAQQTTPSVSAIERAARTINDVLTAEARFPALEDYIQNGVTADYELPRNQAWQPFQSVRTYDLPPKILEQANHGSIKMSMGMFAELGHAWASIDNCIYLWDYTMPNPTLIGYEENKHMIESIKLVSAKPGVFVKEITHVIVVATTVEMMLLGVASSTTSTGAKTLNLYTTKMAIPTKAMGVDHIAGTKSGRVFFTCASSDDLFEFSYLADERWFASRTQKNQYTGSAVNYLPAVMNMFSSPDRTSFVQLALDDSRNLLYALTARNEIQVWAFGNTVHMPINKNLPSLLQSSGHFTNRSELLTGQSVKLVSISPIPATESARLCLVATTNTGCRLYISLHRGYGSPVDAQNPPNQMAISHVRMPPTDTMAVTTQRAQPGQPLPPQQNNEAASQYLVGTTDATRLPPGYSLIVLHDKERNGRDKVFCLAEDSGRLKNAQDTSALSSRFVEFGQWLTLPSVFIEMQVLGAPFGAATTPAGFGNELAVQFDRPATEIGILSASGISILRRRRLVDIFAALMRHSADDEGIDGDIKRFIRSYGRGETAATALAVACSQGLEVTPDSRVASVTDPDVIEKARATFVEHGGRPEFNANAVMDGGSAIDSVRPSPRHEGLALYIGRLVRSIWKVNVVLQQEVPGQTPIASSPVPLDKLRTIQENLTQLQSFLDKNRSYIEGLAGPQALGRLGSRQDEIAQQGEHRAMNSLLQLIRNVIEGISFALVLFDERIQDILGMLAEETRKQVLQLTYEGLFVTSAGRDLAKELVKAIVNRNIANGSNVETVAEALRRRCGSFCSADDVVIFKAQEQVKKAQANGAQTETGRALLNESQRYFQKVAGALSSEHLQWAVDQYVQAQFWAGAIQVCLSVAHEKDKADRALGWLKDGSADGDDRRSAFDARKKCYDLIFSVIQAIDNAVKQTGTVDGAPSLVSRRKSEAQAVINSTNDQVFQTCLYDWYLSIGQADRLLEIDSPFVVEYLRRRKATDRSAADLLWRYHVHGRAYLDAASVQLELARGFFQMSLEERIQYLGHAHINASTRQAAIMESRQSRQELLRTIDDLLEVANIQIDILQRLKADGRLTAERRAEVLERLDGQILNLEELFHGFADQAGYHDICLLIYQCADHRNPADIRNSWQALIKQTDEEAQAIYGKDVQPWEAVGIKVREVGKRINTSEAIFPINALFPMLERYALEPRVAKPPSTWAVDILVDLDVPYQTLLPVAEQLYHSNAAPFTGSKRKIIAGHVVYLLQGWMRDSLRRGERIVFGSQESAQLVLDVLASLINGGGLVGKDREDAEVLVSTIKQLLR